LPFHGGNRGSNPLGDANKINALLIQLAARLDLLSKFWPISTL